MKKIISHTGEKPYETNAHVNYDLHGTFSYSNSLKNNIIIISQLGRNYLSDPLFVDDDGLAGGTMLVELPEALLALILVCRVVNNPVRTS